MDDIFLLQPVTTSSFHTPLYGPVLRLHPELLIRPGQGREAGEMTSMRVAGAALSSRFGFRDPNSKDPNGLGREVRSRPYIAHDVRNIPLPLFHEAKLVFPEVWQLTAHARTRGGDPRRPESHTLWLTIHFIVERHREVRAALLCQSAYVCGQHDTNRLSSGAGSLPSGVEEMAS
jgi:hypothetical protein